MATARLDTPPWPEYVPLRFSYRWLETWQKIRRQLEHLLRIIWLKWWHRQCQSPL